MKRWNGWGDDSIDYPLKASARDYLSSSIGAVTAPVDASLASVLAAVAPSALTDWADVHSDPQLRLLHARGQSFPDWCALRSGEVGPLPDAVALPESHEQVAGIMAEARRRGVIVIPYGGGTSVVGHLQVPHSERPVLSLSLQRMNRLLDLDETCRLATFGAGVAGPDLEAQLRAHGYMLGHFPQSFDYSTLGGWVVTKSSGQQSLRYGRIEQMFASGRLATYKGDWQLPSLPATGAGVDVRDLVLGSEGRLGVLTEAQVRVRPVPQQESFHAVFFPHWEAGCSAIRSLIQAGVDLSMLRLSNAVETDSHLQLAGHPRLIAALEKYLALRGVGAGKVMLTFGVTGKRADCTRARRAALALSRGYKGVYTGTLIGSRWRENRFRSAYLRNSLWAAGFGADTAETAVNWNQVTPLMQAIEAAAREALASFNERVHVFTHLSHVYAQGSSIYSTFVFRLAADMDENLARWQALKAAVSEAIVMHGGTISHQHGVGVDHRDYLAAEKGEAGLDALRALAREFDPDGLLNPGKLVD